MSSDSRIPSHFSLPFWVGLAPWLVFALGLKFLPLAAPVLALATGLLLAWPTRTSLNPLDIGVLVYFLFLTVLAFTAMGQNLSPSVHFALCPAVLAVAAAVSVACRRPFTFAYARPYAPKHLCDQPAFFRANQWISIFWTMGFAAAAAGILLLPGKWSAAKGGLILSAALTAATGASILVGSWFHFRESRTTS